MVFLASIGILLVLVILLATGGAAALPLVLFIPIVAIIVYLVWMFIKRAFTARPN